ncbi:MAG: glutathione S-transferase family protein [Pseudomonadota bacterium]
MPKFTLYHCPGACSQVSVCALEEAGLDYEINLVDITAGRQNEPEYLALSPLGKVPLLKVDGVVLSENAAILTYIARAVPHSGLLPPADADPWVQAQAQSGLSFCGGTLHPQVRGLMSPQRFTTGDDVKGIREKSAELVSKSFRYADQKMARGWWLDEWSIVDVYLNWAFDVALRAGFDGKSFPNLASLSSRLSERASFRRMLEVDRIARTQLGR